MSAKAFVAELSTSQDLSHLVTCHLFETIPHIFDGDLDGWREWKSELAQDLGIDAHSIHLVGSAAVGVSLNPYKNLKPYDEDSDVDVAVLSARHFENAWHTLREMTPSELFRLSRPAQLDIKEHAPTYVYFGSIATERILSVLSFGPRWAGALEKARQRQPTLDRDVKIRLYRDIDSLRRYQIRSIRKVREIMAARA